MKRPLLLVSDVDRTLLTHGYDLPKQVVETLSDARASGLKIVLATARSPKGLRPYAEQLGVADLAICMNGGWVGNVSTGAILRTSPLDRPLALTAMEAAARLGLNPMWFAGEAVEVLENNSLVRREAAITDEPLQVVAGIEALQGAPGKIMCVAEGPKALSGFDRLRAELGDRLSVSGSHPRLLEIGPAGVSKRSAASELARELGVSVEACAAAGDAENDLEMMAWAGVAVTVANAVPEARRIARFVAPSCDEGGMAEAVQWLMAGACRSGQAA